MASQQPNQSARATPLIRHTGRHGRGDSHWRLIPAVLGSVLFNFGLIAGLAFLLPAPVGAVPVETSAAQNEATVQAEAPEEAASPDPLTIRDIDPAVIDPSRDINYPVNREADISVPDIVNPDEPVGIEGSTGPPINIPLRFGSGDGAGGGLKMLGMEPNWSGLGSPGGMSLRASLLAPGGIGGRSAGTREMLAEKGGGTGASEAAVVGGLHWLIKVQSSDGSWRLDGNFKNKGQANDIAGTAFGLLPFLGAGHTHKAAKGNPFDKPIEKAILFLLRKQDKRTGNLRGGMYGHCLATIALSEDFGLTQDPLLRRPTQAAVNYIVQAQHSAGGWRYSPGEPGDTSVTGWAVMALKSARMSGLDVPEITFRKAVNYLNSCMDPNNNGYGYTSRGSSPTMSAVGLLCRQYLQSWGSSKREMINGIKNNITPVQPPVAPGRPAQVPGAGMYYFYYATQVMHHYTGGPEWKAWNDKMRDSLVKSQDQAANSTLKGSWDPTGDPHAAAGGRLMYTSLCLLTLEVYYRHLPLYQREAGAGKDRAVLRP
jgi:hypothetical protein